eukprot:7427748-Prorocentrum_lima.AAC.1
MGIAISRGREGKGMEGRGGHRLRMGTKGGYKKGREGEGSSGTIGRILIPRWVEKSSCSSS